MKLTILVSSYDALSDCWAPFCHGLVKYWPDCAYPAYLIANTKNFEHERITVIRVGEDKGWSRNLLAALERIDSTYILYFQEDYWINEMVNSLAIDDYVSIMERDELHYLRLLSFPNPDRDYAGDERLGVIATQSSYRTALQASLWRKEVLRDLIEPSETPWEFEINGTERSRQYGTRFLSVKTMGDDPYYYGIRYVCTAVNRGRWSKAAKLYAEKEGLDVNFGHLPSETWWHEYQRSSWLGAAASSLCHRTKLLVTNPVIAAKRIQNRMSLKNLR